MIDIQLLENELSTEDCTNWVCSYEVGGVVVFVGTVRNQTKGKRVLKLEFEAYAWRCGT